MSSRGMSILSSGEFGASLDNRLQLRSSGLSNGVFSPRGPVKAFGTLDLLNQVS